MEDTPGTFSKTNTTNSYKFMIGESGHLSKEVLAEFVIMKKARKILSNLTTSELNEIRIPVEKPQRLFQGIVEELLYSDVCTNNYYIVHFIKVRLTDQSFYWKFTKIDY